MISEKGYHVLDNLFASILLQKVARALDEMESPVRDHLCDGTALVWFECHVLV